MAGALDREGAWALDWTEVPGLDDLAWPRGPIAAAEEGLARAFGGREAAILVGGSTAGILAAVLAFGRDRPVALGPSQHRSVYAALALAGARPVFLPEDVDPGTGLTLGVRVHEARAVIESARPALVLVTYPTYQGVALPLEGLAEAAHATGALLLADSAHGAHFGLDPRLPEAALAAGADIAVLGLHKSLGALTQTAALAWRERVDGAPLRATLRLLQSSSPSYLLMASADASREAMCRSGSRRWRHALDRAERVRGFLGAAVWEPGVARDPSRLLWLSPSGHGHDLLEALGTVGVESEYADQRGVLLLLGPNLGAAQMDRLERALDRARRAVEMLPSGARRSPKPHPPLVPGRSAAMLDALAAEWESAALEDAPGRIAADFLVPYPPGVPVAVPGARLDGGAVERLRDAVRSGREVQGIGPGGTIRVVRTERGSTR